MGSPPERPTHSTFRTVAVAVAAPVAILYVLAAVAIVRHGGHVRDFGWVPGTANGTLIVSQVNPNGSAAGVLQPGDAVTAWNGDERVTRVGVMYFRRALRGDGEHTLTIRRSGVEQDVVLRAPLRLNDDVRRLAFSNLVASLVWIVVAMLIALYRPELPVSRSAYIAGMVMGVFMLGQARFSAMPALPDWWRTALLFVVPVFPLNLAVGYAFYLRFPPGVSVTRLWRGLEVMLFAVCAVLFVFGPFIDTLSFIIVPDRVVTIRDALLPIDRWLHWPARLIYLFGALAIVAVAARNYGAVQREDDRRRVRWAWWGTVLGLAPFLTFQVVGLARQIAGLPFDFTRWNALVNLALVLIPACFGYAIIKHRVFDITVVVRRGLQYLLARNALRILLALPLAGLAYGMFVHREQPLGQLLWTNSLYLYLIIAALVSLRFRTRLTRWLDRRFFREAYDRQRVLVELIDNVEKLESASSVSKLVSHELNAVFHPECLFIWHREGHKQHLTLSYSSGGYIHAVELSPASPLLQLAERAGSIVSWPPDDAHALPDAEREWLAEARVRLIVPMIGSERQLAGLMLLGDKKSEEPYSGDDLRLLQAIARQIAIARENVHLKERVDQDRRLRHDVLAHLATGAINVLKECPLCGRCYDVSDTACASDGSDLVLSLPVERTIDGKYRLERLIGKGGMGAVYEANDLRLSRVVAVKIMLGRAFGDRVALRRFEREAQICARLTHPNIVTIFDFGAVGAEGAYFVMEHVQGRTLRHELERRGWLPGVVASIWFEQICEGVSAAHQRQVVHRDLKPENVLIAPTATGGEIIKLLDFGLAKVRSAAEETAGLTNPGIVMGTAGYMAPEQLTGSVVDHRVDVFAVGVMAAEAIVGRRPFQGRTPTDLLLSIMNDSVSLGGDGQERRHLESVLRRATAADPAQRYPSIAALASHLVPALRALPTAVTDAETRTA